MGKKNFIFKEIKISYHTSTKTDTNKKIIHEKTFGGNAVVEIGNSHCHNTHWDHALCLWPRAAFNIKKKPDIMS